MGSELRHTQLLVHELGRECNLSGLHWQCPSGLSSRYGDLNTDRELDDDTIINDVRTGYEMGFGGMVAFHYYNEPTLQWARLMGLVLAIRAEVPKARFLLWTNGHGLVPNEAKAFDRIVLTDYLGKGSPRDDREFPPVKVLPGKLDGRIVPLTRPNGRRCLRPFNEFVVDNYGNGHLCCADFRGQVKLGNVFEVGYERVVDNFLRVRDEVAIGVLPGFCRWCSIKAGAIGNMVGGPMREAVRHLELTTC